MYVYVYTYMYIYIYIYIYIRRLARRAPGRAPFSPNDSCALLHRGSTASAPTQKHDAPGFCLTIVVDDEKTTDPADKHDRQGANQSTPERRDKPPIEADAGATVQTLNFQHLISGVQG